MAVSNTPVFAQTPILGIGQVSTANTNRDGSTGTYSDIFTAGSNGARIEYIRVVATGTTTAGVVRLFLSTDGSTYRLWKEILISAITPSTSVEVAVGEYMPTRPLVLPATNGKIRASTNNAETFNVFVHGANL